MVVSRRSLLQGFAFFGAAMLRRLALGQSGSEKSASVRPRFGPVREFRGAHLQAVSSDGGEMCVVLAVDGVETWTYRGGQWSKEDASTFPLDASMCVVDLKSWKAVYTTRLEAAPFMVSFFRDSPELYITALSVVAGKSGKKQVVIDLKTGSVKEQQMRDGLFQATRGQRLLTTKGELGKSEVMSVVELPDYREVAHADREVPRGGRSGTDQVVSSRGDSLVYGVDDILVCRRTDDLSILWTRRLGTESSRVWRVAISATGDRVAAVAAAAPWPESPEVARRPLVLQPLYIAVYDGQSGQPMAKFSADVQFSEALALSPDGKLLAVCERVAAEGQNVDLLVDIYDIASSRRITRELHCRVPPGRFQNRAAFAAAEFTADGRYLVASGYDRTKVWEISG
jgi:hypothetical protein